MHIRRLEDGRYKCGFWIVSRMGRKWVASNGREPDRTFPSLTEAAQVLSHEYDKRLEADSLRARRERLERRERRADRLTAKVPRLEDLLGWEVFQQVISLMYDEEVTDSDLPAPVPVDEIVAVVPEVERLTESDRRVLGHLIDPAKLEFLQDDEDRWCFINQG